MKKILDFFDYIAYRMHKFVIAHPRMIVPDAAPFIFSLVFEYRTGGARLGKGLDGRDDPNLIVDTKFEPDPNNQRKVRYVEE